MGRRREGPGCLVARTAQVVQVASFGWANYGGCLAIASAACTRRFSTNQGAACSGDGMQLVRVATHSRHCARTRKASTARKACCPHDDTADLAPECHTRISWSSSPPGMIGLAISRPWPSSLTVFMRHPSTGRALLAYTPSPCR